MYTHTRRPIGQRLLSAITLIAMVLGMASFASPQMVQADTVGGQVFLQGNYVEVGIHSNGYFGTSQNAPAGFHPIGRTRLGFVADIGMDGWAVGTPPQSGDYFLPGGPEQGFGVKLGTYTANNNGSGSLAQITPISLTETSLRAEAVWVGQATSGADTLQVTRRATVKPNDLAFTIFVELRNTGSTTPSAVKYLETLDPDNDVDLGGDYTTDNSIIYQPGVGGNTSLAQVAAVGTVYPSVAVRLSTNDSRARVSVGGFSVRDPDVVLSAPACTPNGSTVCNTAPGVVTRGDIAISLAYNLGDLAPGESVTFQYRYQLSDIAANNLPVATDDVYTATLGIPLTVVTPGVLDNDTDADGDPLIAVKVTDPANGALTLNPEGSFIYTPTVGFGGSDTFTYKANDGQSDSNVATVTINVPSPLNPPTITSPVTGTVTHDNTPTFVGTAESGMTVLVREMQGTVFVVLCQAVADGDGNWSCTPENPLADGEHTTSAVAVDGDGNESAPTEVIFTIETSPIAVDDLFSVPENVPARSLSTLDVLANDSDPNDDDLTIVAVSVPAHGVATTNGATIIYTPTTGYLGLDNFTYTISDGATEDTAQVTVTVLPVADLAVAQTIRGTMTGLEIVLVARNLGPRPASGAVISDTFSTILSNVTWTCTASGGAACPSASGAGDLYETLATFPANGVVTYTITSEAANDIAFNTVTITPPEGIFDLDMSNNSATRQTLYRVILPITLKNYLAP